MVVLAGRLIFKSLCPEQWISLISLGFPWFGYHLAPFRHQGAPESTPGLAEAPQSHPEAPQSSQKLPHGRPVAPQRTLETPPENLILGPFGSRNARRLGESITFERLFPQPLVLPRASTQLRRRNLPRFA